MRSQIGFHDVDNIDVAVLSFPAFSIGTEQKDLQRVYTVDYGIPHRLYVF